jgi:tetratricopeptide (TPR) repeat protein
MTQSRRLVVAASMLVALASAARADTPTKEAGKHFQRGVALYNEADYRAALVEFRRAYEIAPNAVVLYNIGETQYQLQNYAAALTTLERYLNESGATATHRPEVEQTLDILRARVGKVEVKTNLPDCEVTIDDEVVGKSPLASPVLVSIGRRKVTAMHAGRQAETRFVEVAAGDTVGITLALADPEGVVRAGPTAVAPDPNAGARLIRIGWITTGVLAVGALTTGIFAWRASSDLDDARHTFGETPGDLQNKASHVTTLSAVADIIGAVAIVTGGVTLGLTLSRSRSHEVHVGLAPRGVLIGGTFQ